MNINGIPSIPYQEVEYFGARKIRCSGCVVYAGYALWLSWSQHTDQPIVDLADRYSLVRVEAACAVPTQEGWLYVASIMDLYTRKIVGWHADERMTKNLVLKALDQAYQRQQPKAVLLHHSDRGSQYASREYQERLATYGMIGSMSRKGNCYDNACMESFHSVLKRELVFLEKFKTRKKRSSAYLSK